MNTGNSHTKSRLAKTLIIIIGVIIAFIMTINSPLFAAESDTSSETINTASGTATTAVITEAHLQDDRTASGNEYNSGTRLLQIFTENLPYLNTK